RCPLSFLSMRDYELFPIVSLRRSHMAASERVRVTSIVEKTNRPSWGPVGMIRYAGLKERQADALRNIQPNDHAA
ncbi:MAG: hypothetical protein ABL932_25555, partial [Terricaulis sp.]